MKPQIFKIVFEDDDILVIEKTQAFLSQRADSGSREGLDEFLTRQLKKKIFAVHRLDREVLGLMVYGKNAKAAEGLSQQFKERKILKIYWAEVKGRMSSDSAHLVHYLKKNDRTNYVTVYPRPTEGAKRAELAYQVVKRSDKSTEVLVRILTGRTHQIRVQLAKIGHPISGDSKYGKQNFESDESIQLRSVLLGFEHPRTNLPLCFEAQDSRGAKKFLEAFENIVQNELH